MMATGTSRPFPLAASCINPIARGPAETLDLRAICVHPSGAATETAASRMTTRSALRYNHERRGEVPMEVNDKAPEFNTTDENGKEVASKDFRGKTLVLFFYPRADTPG
jgi:hypothetical protein